MVGCTDDDFIGRLIRKLHLPKAKLNTNHTTKRRHKALFIFFCFYLCLTRFTFLKIVHLTQHFRTAIVHVNRSRKPEGSAQWLLAKMVKKNVRKHW